MKIAIVCDSLDKGGAERQALYSARELARRGHDVDFIRYYKLDDEYDPAQAAPARVTLMLKSGRRIRFIAALARYLRQRKFDVVQGFKTSPSLYACTAALCAGVRVRIAGHRVAWTVEPRLLRCLRWIATAWTANSIGGARALTDKIGVAPDHVHVVYNGIDPDAYRSNLSATAARERLGIPRDAPTVAIIAALRGQKNHPMFVRMAACVAREIPSTRFLLVGDMHRSTDQSFEAVSELARSLGILDRIHFLGQRSDLADVLAAIDVSVLTSDYEGLSNAMMESMTAGRAVVTTDYEGADELVTDGIDGVITPRGDHAAMARVVGQLLHEPARRPRLGDEARRTIRSRFSFDAMADRLLAVYEHYLAAAKGEAKLPRQADSSIP